MLLEKTSSAKVVAVENPEKKKNASRKKLKENIKSESSSDHDDIELREAPKLNNFVLT